MSEERWTEQTEQLAARAVFAGASLATRDDVRAVLAALADAGLLVAPGWHPDPEGSAQLTAYSDGWQYAVAEPDTDDPLVYGDQYWVSSGRAVAECHPRGRLVRRKVAAYAGPWREVTP